MLIAERCKFTASLAKAVSELIAVGNDPLVSNRAEGAPTTIISPSLLFGELEVKRADTSKDKLPDYPAPPLKK